MRRWLFNLAAAVSLVLCVAVGVLGVRSFWHIDAAGARSDAWPQPDKFREREWEVASVSGTLRFVYKQSFSQVGWNESIGWVHEQSPPRLNWYRLAPESWVCISRTSGGFAAEHDVSFPFGQPVDVWFLSIPSWLPMALLMVLPAMWLYRFRKARRVRRLGSCPTCGYDLRATPNRCPECGAVPPVPPVPRGGAAW